MLILLLSAKWDKKEQIKEDKAKNTNTEILLSGHYKLFVINKFSIYSVKPLQPEIIRPYNEYKIHQNNCTVTSLYKLTEISRIYGIMHAKHSARLRESTFITPRGVKMSWKKPIFLHGPCWGYW
jgi:hypothetical protein